LFGHSYLKRLLNDSANALPAGFPGRMKSSVILFGQAR